jgi:hypothetical protein
MLNLYHQKLLNLRWRCGSSSRAPAQQAQDPRFKPPVLSKRRKRRKQLTLWPGHMDMLQPRGVIAYDIRVLKTCQDLHFPQYLKGIRFGF